jgi:predicted oxidoreductase
LQVSQVAYGCMRLNADRGAAVASLRAALDQGINCFDHADIYGAGRCEAVFSAIWREVPGMRQQIVVQSKCGIRFENDPTVGAPKRYDFSREHILAAVDGSLRRLQTDYLDLLLLHRPDALVEPEEVAEAFARLKQTGRVRYFGVSNHTGPQIELLRRYLKEPLVANQLQLSLLHNGLIDTGIVTNQMNPPWPLRGDGTLEYCRLQNIMIQAWGPLAGGVLAGRLPDGADARVVRLAETVMSLARQRGVSAEAIAVAWLLRHPAHIQAIIGTTDAERIRACCQATEIELSREDWYALFNAGRGAPVP